MGYIPPVRGLQVVYVWAAIGATSMDATNNAGVALCAHISLVEDKEVKEAEDDRYRRHRSPVREVEEPIKHSQYQGCSVR